MTTTQIWTPHYFTGIHGRCDRCRQSKSAHVKRGNLHFCKSDSDPAETQRQMAKSHQSLIHEMIDAGKYDDTASIGGYTFYRFGRRVVGVCSDETSMDEYEDATAAQMVLDMAREPR